MSLRSIRRTISLRRLPLTRRWLTAGSQPESGFAGLLVAGVLHDLHFGRVEPGLRDDERLRERHGIRERQRELEPPRLVAHRVTLDSRQLAAVTGLRVVRDQVGRDTLRFHDQRAVLDAPHGMPQQTRSLVSGVRAAVEIDRTV